MIGKWREKLNAALPPATPDAPGASAENRAPMNFRRIAQLAIAAAFLLAIGFVAFSPERQLPKVVAVESTAVAQTTAPTILRVEDYVPVPEPVDVPPLSLADLLREGGEVRYVSLVPEPEIADVPPPTAADIGTVPAPALTAADLAIADKLREVVGSRLDRLFSRKNERAAVETFYRERNFAPLWIDEGKTSARAAAAIAFLKTVDADGLDPAEYAAPDFKSIAEASALAEAELKFTGAILDFVRHAQNGRVHFTRITYDILYFQDVPEPAEVLAKIAGAKDVGATLDEFLPQHPGYKALKAKLAEARAQVGDPGPAHIGAGPLLKVGMTDPRVPLLRERLGVPGSGDVYDKALADAVKKFQSQRKLSPTGNLTTATIDALNPPRRENRFDTIIANLERWRWMPRDLGKVYVMVNIPDFTLRVVRDGKTVWATKIVVGKPGNLATPITSASMQYITVNPTWNVPPSIIQNEYLPALQQDPDAMTRIGLKVTTNPDGTIHISQPPGDRNALGRIRFNFPNKFLVYQHDTPDKQLFAHEKRAYSHGCMRVQDPIKYAEVLLSIVLPNQGYTQERIKSMFGPSEIDIRFPTHIPVHLTYQTAFVDDAGALQFREDIYGRDARVLAVLKSNERRIADIAVERRAPGTINREALRLPDQHFRSNNFFQWFFNR